MDELSNTTGNLSGGTGKRLGNAVIILTGVCTLIAILITVLAVWLQLKNYRKPLLQRYVVRILVLVPIFSAASWASLVSLKASAWIEPFRDVYEAFVIYAFFQLLINFIGGERALIILMHGRPPVSHPWPISTFCNKIDISDPHTFLAIKRGILQYAWIKPMLAMATIVMKATDTFKGGYTTVKSGYFWSGIVYNISITISLYALAMFWVCMSADLKPFRPMPKFLCIKGIIFASYWQGFMLSILVSIGLVPDDVPGYSPDNIAAAVQDALICIEMPIFALAQWYAFSWKDYADITISAARMPVKFAFRDACGAVDLIQDAKDTFKGGKYDYRYFDAGDDILAHEESGQRVARMMEGMRYERGGKGKYWIPKPGQVDSKTPLLQEDGKAAARSGSSSRERQSAAKYGTTTGEEAEEPDLEDDEEKLYDNARALEFGDWNYPVITAHHASRDDRMYENPRMVTNSTNRHLLQPTKANQRRRKSAIRNIQDSADKGKHRASSSSTEASSSRVAKVWKKITPSSPDSGDKKDDLVDLIIEDDQAEEVERVRARKEGSPEWNKHEPKHFVRAFPESDEEEEVIEGHEPSFKNDVEADQLHAVGPNFGKDASDGQEPAGADEWRHREYRDEDPATSDDQENPWRSPRK